MFEAQKEKIGNVTHL